MSDRVAVLIKFNRIKYKNITKIKISIRKITYKQLKAYTYPNFC